MVATQLERINWSGLRDQINLDDGDFNNIFGQTYNFNDQLEQNFPTGANLKIINTHGAISVPGDVISGAGFSSSPLLTIAWATMKVPMAPSILFSPKYGLP